MGKIRGDLFVELENTILFPNKKRKPSMYCTTISAFYVRFLCTINMLHYVKLLTNKILLNFTKNLKKIY